MLLVLDGFGELTSVFITNISWCSTCEFGNGILFRILGHVDSYESLRVSKYFFGKFFGKKSLTAARLS